MDAPVGLPGSYLTSCHLTGFASSPSSANPPANPPHPPRHCAAGSGPSPRQTRARRRAPQPAWSPARNCLRDTAARINPIRLVVLLLQVERHRPRLRPHRGILDRGRVLERLRVEARPPFHEVEILVRPLEIRLGREVRHIDNQRVALPATARVPPPETDAGGKMRRRGDRDDPLPALSLTHVVENRDLSLDCTIRRKPPKSGRAEARQRSLRTRSSGPSERLMAPPPPPAIPSLM